MSYLAMLSLGFLDASTLNLCHILLGFEFESKVTPFSLKTFISAMAVFVLLIVVAYLDVLNDQTSFRIFYGLMMIFGLMAITLAGRIKD